MLQRQPQGTGGEERELAAALLPPGPCGLDVGGPPGLALELPAVPAPGSGIEI